MTSVVLQLDPASLALWFGVPGSGDDQADRVYKSATDAALAGDQAGVETSIGRAADERTAVRAAALASSVWHEMRHFVDLTLTSFGAFKTRRYLSLYANMAPVLSGLRSPDGRVHCPITDYLDPATRLVHGLNEPSTDILRILRDVRQRSEMTADDLSLLDTAGGRVSVGGKAQLEAVAYMCQSATLLDLLGDAGISVKALWDVPDADVVRNNYTWTTALESMGLLSRGVELGRGLVSLSGEPLLPLLVGALSSRHWGQAQIRDDSGGSGFPAERLYGLASRLGPTWKKAWPSWETAWDQVNDAASTLWGRSVLDELDEDVRRFSEYAEQVASSRDPEDALTRWIRDVADVRRAMLALLRDAPERVLRLNLLPGLASTIDVPLIAAAPAGQDYPLPDNYGRISAFAPPGAPAESGWWWAAAWRFPDASKVIGFSDFEAWAKIASQQAPLAKLLIQGRRHRVMLGPELVTAEQVLRSQGVDLSFAPYASLPEGDASSAVFWHFRSGDWATCDTCRAAVPRPEGALVSPWAFRADRALAGLAVAALGEEGMSRDWSHWFVCKPCQERLTILVDRRHRHLVGGESS